jgi:hypothetical protein
LVYLRKAQDISIRQTPPASFYQQPETHYSVSPTESAEYDFRQYGLKSSADTAKPIHHIRFYLSSSIISQEEAKSPYRKPQIQMFANVFLQ